jgi:hypothetical protein
MKNTLQVKAKAYPGIKELAIARGLGDQGIAASICAKQLTDNSKPDYGYGPAVRAIIDRLKLALAKPCLPRKLTPALGGQVPCLILEGRQTSGGACTCDSSKARAYVSEEHLPAQQAAENNPDSKGLDCFCEIEQASNAAPTPGALTDCQTATPATSNGWCYVDADNGPAQAGIVAKCPATERHEIRFVGSGAPQLGATLFITCSGQ